MTKRGYWYTFIDEFVHERVPCGFGVANSVLHAFALDAVDALYYCPLILIMSYEIPSIRQGHKRL